MARLETRAQSEASKRWAMSSTSCTKRHESTEAALSHLRPSAMPQSPAASRCAPAGALNPLSFASPPTHIIDQHVDSSKPLACLLHGLLHIPLVPHIQHDGECLCAASALLAQLLNLRGRTVDRAGELGVRRGRLGGDDDVGAAQSERARDGETDAAGGAGAAEGGGAREWEAGRGRGKGRT